MAPSVVEKQKDAAGWAMAHRLVDKLKRAAGWAMAHRLVDKLKRWEPGQMVASEKPGFSQGLVGKTKISCCVTA